MVGRSSSVVVRSRLQSFGVVRRHPQSFGVVQSRLESFGVVRSHPGSSGIIWNRLESYGVVPSHPVSSETIRSRPESSGHVRSRRCPESESSVEVNRSRGRPGTDGDDRCNVFCGQAFHIRCARQKMKKTPWNDHEISVDGPDSGWLRRTTWTPDESRRLQMTPDDFGRLQMTPDDSKRHRMTRDDSRWFQKSRYVSRL